MLAKLKEAISSKKRVNSILVVDDDAPTIHLIRRAAEQYEFEVEEASSAEGAISIMKENGGKFRLIMLDVLLPGSTGWTFRKEVLARWPEAKIVMMSGAPESFGYLPRGEVVEVMVKPSTFTQFFANLREKT